MKIFLVMTLVVVHLKMVDTLLMKRTHATMSNGVIIKLYFCMVKERQRKRLILTDII